MTVSGFTIIRNAIQYDFPVVESITSILPVCDEFVVAIGKSDDDTLGLIRSIDSPKIKIIKTVWDDNLREGGRVLAVETDKAFNAVSADSDWAFYIQADEIVHENDLSVISGSMQKWKDDKRVEGLLFNYHHFYGSYNYIADSRRWYRKEVRIIRNDKTIYAYRDAQGFRKRRYSVIGNQYSEKEIPNTERGRPLHVKPIGAFINHYGWVKPPEQQQAKRRAFEEFWRSDEWIEKNISPQINFNYSNIDSLSLFKGSHPQVMQKRIREKNWHFDFDTSRNNFSFLSRIIHSIERMLGWRIGEYRNYRVV